MLQPLPGGTHAAIVAAREYTMRRLLFHALEESESERVYIHEADSEDMLLQQAMLSGPSVVVIDAELAAGNGLSACARLKTNTLTCETAVVVISSRYERYDYDQAIALGADAFLVKPFSPVRLRNLVHDLSAEACRRAAQVGDAHFLRRAAGGHTPRPERYDLPPSLQHAPALSQTRGSQAAGSARLAG